VTDTIQLAKVWSASLPPVFDGDVERWRPWNGRPLTKYECSSAFGAFLTAAERNWWVLAWALLLILISLTVFPSGAGAQESDEGFWSPRADYVRLLGEAAAGREFGRTNALLQERLELEQAKSAALRELLDLERQKSDKLRDLARIDEERADHWKARVDDVRAEAARETRKARTIAGCASGALGGSAVFPGIGTLVGAGIGCAAGFLLP